MNSDPPRDARSRLAAHGCDEMQGYLFSRPQEVEEITALLTGQLLGGGPQASDLAVTDDLEAILHRQSP